MRVFLFLLLFISLLFSCSHPEQKTIKLSLILGDTSSWYAGAKKWQELVRERSAGKIIINIYPNAQLAANNQRTELEMVQSGVIDASIESTILLSLIDQRFSVFSLPFLFSSYPEAFSRSDSDAGEALLKILPEKNLVGLAYGVNGFRQLTNLKKEVRELKDLANLKIRVPSMTLYIDIFKTYKADPSSMNFGELFTALAQKTMDGQENPLHVINSSKLYEVQKYLFMWNYSYDPVILCINKKKWDSFSEEERALLKSCANEAFVYQRDLVVKEEAALIEELKKKNMIITAISQKALNEFQKASQPIYRQYRDIITEEIYNLFVKN